MMLSQAKRAVAITLTNGQQQWRNIAVSDLVYYLTGVLSDPRSYGTRFEVGGDDVLTNDQMLDTAADLLGRAPPTKLHLPRRLMGALAPVIERVARLPRGAFRGLIDGMDSEMVGDPLPIRQLLPRTPLSYRQALQQALRATEE